MRRRHESAHAIQIHQQSALVVVGDLGLDRLVGLVKFLESSPALFLAGSVDRNDRLALLVFRLDDEDEDRLPDIEGALLVIRQAGEFARGDYAFRLRSDVDENLITVDAHDDAIHDIAIFERLVVKAGIVEKLFHKRERLSGLIGFAFQTRIDISHQGVRNRSL